MFGDHRLAGIHAGVAFVLEHLPPLHAAELAERAVPVLRRHHQEATLLAGIDAAGLSMLAGSFRNVSL